MKKQIAVILAMTLCLLSFGTAIGENSTETLTSGDYEYTLTDAGTVCITKYNGAASELMIPEEIEGKQVTAIGRGAFVECKTLLNVTVPEGVTAIGDEAFVACYSLQSITLPDSIAEMGEHPFYSCSDLTDFRFSPDHPYLEVIDGVLFSKTDHRLVFFPVNSKKDVETYEVPQGTEIIGSYAFAGCQCTKILLPDSLKEIRSAAFSNCRKLLAIDLPGGLTVLGLSALHGCKKLASVTIPDGVTILEGFVFSDCKMLMEVNLPKNLTGIGQYAFSGCESLQMISLPKTVESIGDAAFSECPALTIQVAKGSWAEQYCRDEGLNYTAK